MPMQISVRSRSRVSRSQRIFLMDASGSARCAAAATVNELTTANTTAQAIAVSITDGRVSQACAFSAGFAAGLASRALGVIRWNVAEVAAPARPSAAELNIRR